MSRKKPSGGLSTGAIIAIIIPCALVLIAAIIASIACGNSKQASPSAFVNESYNNLYIKN